MRVAATGVKERPAALPSMASMASPSIVESNTFCCQVSSDGAEQIMMNVPLRPSRMAPVFVCVCCTTAEQMHQWGRTRASIDTDGG